MANNCKHCFNTHYQPHCHPTTKNLWLCSSVYCRPPHQSRRIWLVAAAKKTYKRRWITRSPFYTGAATTKLSRSPLKAQRRPKGCLDREYVIINNKNSLLDLTFLVSLTFYRRWKLRSRRRVDPRGKLACCSPLPWPPARTRRTTPTRYHRFPRKYIYYILITSELSSICSWWRSCGPALSCSVKWNILRSCGQRCI